MGKQAKEVLFTSSFILACIGNFLLFFGFYILLPILPLYLIEVFQTSKSTVGIVLSCYTLAALFIRPFSAYLTDMFNRKPIYLWSYFLFILVFVAYPIVASVGFFLLIRVLHGLAFGAVTTTGNTFIVDIMPASRRGEGLGYFGTANNLAMAIGPMTGLFLHDMTGSYNLIFYTAIFSGAVGFICASLIKSPTKIITPKEKISLDRFYLSKGILSGLCLLMLGIPYGITMTYTAIYGAELGITQGLGVFFSLLALGMISSRLFAGKLVDKGKMILVISTGSFICSITFLFFSSFEYFTIFSSSPFLVYLFYLVAVLLGVGYGMMFPAYNALFVNLAPHNRRATASSTYLTSWDIGIGVGLILGGYFADLSSLAMSYFVGAVFAFVSTFIFIKWAGVHYERNKLNQ